MTVTVTETKSGLCRNYVATVKRGKRKGEQVAATVPDCGHGWKLFWDKVEQKFGKCYTE